MTFSLMLRHARLSKKAPGLRNRRLLSTPTPSPKPTLPPPGIPALVSRRQWNKLYKPPPRKPRNKNADDEKPWPRSVQIAGYAAGVTVVPYCIAWFIALNVTVREALDPLVPGMVPLLRQWFGDEDLNAVSYVDRRAEGDKLIIPKSLVDEIDTKARKEQAALQPLLTEHPVPSRLRVYMEGGFNLSEIVDLPGTTLANTKTLLAVLMKDRDRAIEEDVVTSISVEFTDVREANQEGTDDDMIVELQLPEDTSTLKSQITHMLKTTSIFSAWHYFPEILMQQQEQNRQQQEQPQAHARRQDELRIGQLEYEIEELEKQLKDHSTMRSFDDIQEDLSRNKSELRRLKWRKRLNLFG